MEDDKFTSTEKSLSRIGEGMKKRPLKTIRTILIAGVLVVVSGFLLALGSNYAPESKKTASIFTPNATSTLPTIPNATDSPINSPCTANSGNCAVGNTGPVTQTINETPLAVVSITSSSLNVPTSTGYKQTYYIAVSNINVEKLFGLKLTQNDVTVDLIGDMNCDLINRVTSLGVPLIKNYRCSFVTDKTIASKDAFTFQPVSK